MEIPSTRNRRVLFGIKVRKTARNIAKRLVDPILQKKYESYKTKRHEIEFEGLRISILPGVFPPHFLISTKALVRFLKTQNIEGETLLELGCGTGALACWASKKGARVTASDINPSAIENAEINAVQNQLNVEVIRSDLFENLPSSFDWIVINPPYYPKNPLNDEERAWYAGENFEYFQRLFQALAQKVNWRNCIMVLSEDCDVEAIRSICQNESLEMHLVKTDKGIVEHNYIFKIQPSHAK